MYNKVLEVKFHSRFFAFESEIPPKLSWQERKNLNFLNFDMRWVCAHTALLVIQ